VSDVVRDIANAVLYEGHMLFPYRPSSLKNVQRWTFGGVYPPAYARSSGDRSRIGFQCVVEGADPVVEVELRYLRVLGGEARECTAAAGPVADPPGLVTACLERGVLTVGVENTSTWTGAVRQEALEHSFVSAHVVARVAGGAFVSPRESGEPLAHDGLWPVLVGEPGDRSTLLASPIILDDYPRVAPESPGDFFDGCEIDQLLVLSILGLSDAEKDEIRAGDARARAILERTEAMSHDDVMRLHGTWREP
jgi:hypothetical protein